MKERLGEKIWLAYRELDGRELNITGTLIGVDDLFLTIRTFGNDVMVAKDRIIKIKFPQNGDSHA